MRESFTNPRGSNSQNAPALRPQAMLPDISHGRNVSAKLQSAGRIEYNPCGADDYRVAIWRATGLAVFESARI
jgi:hypothetical protein